MSDTELHFNRPEDSRLVAASWWHGNLKPMADVHMAIYKPFMDRRINRILETASYVTMTLAGLPEEVLAYIVFEPGILHFVYTKQPYRKRGFGKHLVEKFGHFDFRTHQPYTPAGKKLVGHIPYNPFLLEPP